MAEKATLLINDDLAIPESELAFRFSTSSGPGGQHTNRAATRVTLLFDLEGSPSLDEATRARLREKLANRLDQRGVLRVQVQDSRSQKRNRDIAISRLMGLLADALQEVPERKNTRPPATAVEQRLEQKKQRGTRKRERGRDWSRER